MGTTDLHIHSAYSFDATTTVRAILKQAKDTGLDVIAVTDHDEIRGSLEAHALAAEYGIKSIIGAEVSTKEGHLIALWIHDLPPKGLSLLDTLLIIGKQGGIAIAAHPFSSLPNSLSMGSVVGALANPRAKAVLLGIETDNMSTQAFNGVVRKLSIYLPLAKLAVSDSHDYWSVGAGRTEFPGETAQDLRHALEHNTTVPIPYEGNFSPGDALNWVRRITLKKLGYVSDTKSASQPINTQRMSQTFIGKMKKKQ